MMTMEFDELKKIWDTQNNEPMYAINETALHKRIQEKGQQVDRLVNTNEIGLMIICIATGSFIMFKAISGSVSVYSFVVAAVLFFIAIYIYWKRTQRLNQQNRYELSLLEELDQAIAKADLLIRSAKSMVWWFILPIALATTIKMLNDDNVEIWRWLIVNGSYVVSYFVIQAGIKYKHLPRKRRLEALRQKLTELQG